jgi:hypothetical protein
MGGQVARLDQPVDGSDGNTPMLRQRFLAEQGLSVIVKECVFGS